jgi:hypothetical protein
MERNGMLGGWLGLGEGEGGEGSSTDGSMGSGSLGVWEEGEGEGVNSSVSRLEP